MDGIGQLLITAIYANDLPMVQTLAFIFAALVVVFDLIADLLYGVLDPKIRYDRVARPPRTEKRGACLGNIDNRSRHCLSCLCLTRRRAINGGMSGTSSKSTKER